MKFSLKISVENATIISALRLRSMYGNKKEETFLRSTTGLQEAILNNMDVMFGVRSKKALPFMRILNPGWCDRVAPRRKSTVQST